MKATAIAPSNIAFIKYWGRKDENLRLPVNGSISMNLSNLLTTTTVEFDSVYPTDEVIIDGVENRKETERVTEHLDRIRNKAGISLKAKVVSKNNFPSSTGLSSSASGFAALTVAAAKAAGLVLSEKELSILARKGSGSACRSIPSGFTEWIDGNTDEESRAVSLFEPDYWELADVVAIISKEKKDVPTSEGQKRAQSSVFFQTRQNHMEEKIRLCKKYLKEKNFMSFGELIEAEALELHAIMLTSIPSLIYWQPSTITMMKHVQKWRNEGLPVYFTMNTGQDIHLICKKENVKLLMEKIESTGEVSQTIQNYPSVGTKESQSHLF